jgi:drug/metabolite transporter (DMT)-like permease
MFFVLLFPVRDDGVAPLLVVRLTTCLIVLVAAAWSGQLALPPLRIWPAATAGGLLEVTAHLCYLAAVRHGMLALVAVLSSLYPVSTVLLARVVLRERFGGAQVVGLGLAMVGVTLIGLTG